MARLDPLTEYLLRSRESRVRLTFADVERVIGGPLPASAHRHPAFWSNSEKNSYSSAWRTAGYAASRANVGPEEVQFNRSTDFREAAVRAPDSAASHEADMGAVTATAPLAAVLVGCVATKGERPTPAKDLYTSDLFRRRRRYAEASGSPWFVASALHGLVGPDDVIEPYDRSMADLAPSERAEWGQSLVAALELDVGSLRGRSVEIHAGEEYVFALRRPLGAAGATLVRPLVGLRIGEQLQWYDQRLSSPTPVTALEAPSQPPPIDDMASAERVGAVVRAVSEAFTRGGLDLAGRMAGDAVGWDAMPEVAVAHRLLDEGMSQPALRRFLTFVAAMDRARDADRLWFAAAALWRHSPGVFEPERVVAGRLTDLSDALRASGVSQRHGSDVMAWRLIAESLVDAGTSPVMHRAIEEGEGDAQELLAALQARSAAGTLRFPMLAGPKVGPMWVRMLAVPGGVHITSLDVLPVAVDVQVRKVTEYLGVTDTGGLDLEQARGPIQQAWREGLSGTPAAGPPELGGTAAALDPALWFWAKWGCSFCERAGRKLPIGEACSGCRFPQRGPAPHA